MSSRMMDVSVIIPIYNVEKYIEKCLRSLFTQTKTDGVEFILVNDCTKDNSIVIAQRVIAEFSGINAKIINHEVNKGLAGARATGVAAAVGEYIQHIDSDDWCESTMLEELYTKAKECDADIVGCDYYIDYGTSLKYVSMPMGEDNVECLKMVLSSKLTQSLCFKLVKRELYNHDVNYFIQGLDTWEDLVASVKLFYFAKNVTYIPKAFYHYMQIDNNSISRSGFSQKRLDNIIAAVDDIENFIAITKSKNFLKADFEKRKIYAKFLLIRSSGKSMKKYTNIYPEINNRILYHDGMPLHNRFALYFASLNIISLFRLIIYSVAKLKKMK